MLECIRQVKKGKQKEIRPEDLLIDFDNQEASKPLVSNKSTSSKSSTHKKYEEYGTAGSSGLTHNEKATPVITDLQLMTMRTMNYINRKKRRKEE